MLCSGALNGVQNDLFSLLSCSQLRLVEDIFDLGGSLSLRLFSKHAYQLFSRLFSAQACKFFQVCNTLVRDTIQLFFFHLYGMKLSSQVLFFAV